MKKQLQDEYVFTREHNPFREFGKSYNEEQAAKKVAAVLINPEMERVPFLADYEHDKQPLLVIDRTIPRVVVNRTFFGSLERIDAPRLFRGEIRVIGTLTGAGLALDHGFVFSFLLDSQIVETYWHIEARCRLVSFQDTGAEASAVFEAVHIYFTNEKNEEKYGFILRLDKKSGEMTITGAPAS